MAVHVLYLYHTLPWLRAVLYEYSCTVILIPVQRTSTVQLYFINGRSASVGARGEY